MRPATRSAEARSGFSARSRGELVHTDYLFDAFGADDGDDGERVARNDELEETSPGLYRLEPTYQYDPAVRSAPRAASWGSRDNGERSTCSNAEHRQA